MHMQVSNQSTSCQEKQALKKGEEEVKQSNFRFGWGENTAKRLHKQFIFWNRARCRSVQSLHDFGL
jgi:hypothetical protein